MASWHYTGTQSIGIRTKYWFQAVVLFLNKMLVHGRRVHGNQHWSGVSSDALANGNQHRQRLLMESTSIWSCDCVNAVYVCTWLMTCYYQSAIQYMANGAICAEWRLPSVSWCIAKGRKGKHLRNNVHKIRKTLSMNCWHLAMRCSKPKDHTMKWEAASVGKGGVSASNFLALWWRKSEADTTNRMVWHTKNEKISISPEHE